MTNNQLDTDKIYLYAKNPYKEKFQFLINREAAKISALSSGKITKYECLTGEEILPSNQKQIIEQAKFTYSLFEKAFQNKKKQLEIKEKTS